MIPDDVITAFFQNGESDCATIGTIKASIARFGLGNVFSSNESNGIYSITLKNQSTLLISQNDINTLKNVSGFTPNFSIGDTIKSQIFDYAILCYAVFVKNYEKINNYSEDLALRDIDGKGIDTDYSYTYLGFVDSDITFLTQNAGTRDVSTLASNNVYILYNDYHTVMASLDHYDEYGSCKSINNFGKNHGSNRVWAYKFN